MQVILSLIQRDFTRIFYHRPLFIVLLTICLIPTGYSFYSIKASRGPYSAANTQSLPIAVVDNDRGATLNNHHFNMGHQIIKKLRHNHQARWITTNDWQGNNGLNQGKYIALIEIPDNFSGQLTTLTSKNPQLPKITYRENEKIASAADMTTGLSKDIIARKIRHQFTKVASQEVLKQANTIGEKLDGKTPEILRIRQSLLSTIKTITKAKTALNKINDQSQSVQAHLKSIHQNIPSVTSQLDDLSAFISHSQALGRSLKRAINSTYQDLGDGLDELRTQNNRMQSLSTALSADLKRKSTATSLKNEINQLAYINRRLLNQANNNIQALSVANVLLPQNEGASLQQSLANIKTHVKAQQALLASAQSLAASSQPHHQKLRVLNNRLIRTSHQITPSLNSATSAFNSRVGGSLQDLSQMVNTDATSNGTISQSLQSIVPDLNQLRGASNTGTFSTNVNHGLTQNLTHIQGSLQRLDGKINFINKKNLNRLVRLLNQSPEMANLFSSPIHLKKSSDFQFEKFGYGVAPFYIVLAIWIGVLLLTTILAWHYRTPKQAAGRQLSLMQQFFGKFVLFLALATIQATFILLSECLLAPMHPESWLALLIISYLTTLSFTIIGFTFVFLFGNIGKVFNILILLIEIFATGGIYPLELMPHGLTTLAAFLPFTYAIQDYREALIGPDWALFGQNSLILLAFAGGILLLIPFKKLRFSPIQLLKRGLREAGF